MSKLLLFATTVTILLVVALACPGDPTHGPHGNRHGHDNEHERRHCYRALNQSCFIDCDRNAPNYFEDAPNTACTNPSGLNHTFYMQYAINITKDAQRFFSAVIVDRTTKEIVATGINRGIGHFTIGHGEINAIINFTSIFPAIQKPFSNYVLYTTGEPCPMCMSAIIYSGFSEVVWASSIPELIAFGWPQINIRAADVSNAQTRPGPKPCLIQGVLADQANPIFANPPFTPIPPNTKAPGNGDHDHDHGHGHDH